MIINDFLNSVSIAYQSGLLFDEIIHGVITLPFAYAFATIGNITDDMGEEAYKTIFPIVDTDPYRPASCAEK